MAVLKGAFINLGAGLLGGLPNIVIFQFNPEKVTRTPTLAQPPHTPVGAGTVDAILLDLLLPARLDRSIVIAEAGTISSSRAESVVMIPLAAAIGLDCAS
jgi:hypothetical protein